MNKLSVNIQGSTFEVILDQAPNATQLTVTVNGEPLRVDLSNADAILDGLEWLLVNGRPYEIDFDQNLHWIKTRDGLYSLDIHDLQATNTRPRSGDGRVKAPIPGLITRVLVEVGQQVEVGQPLLMLEAMKMENEIRAPFTGTVTAIQVSPGQSVVRAEVLAEVS
jgi:biotin carboxyl carrier protein